MPEKNSSVLIRHLAPKNFLSFGPDTAGIDLTSLNILIGPNASGKSNLIEAINLMRAMPKQPGEVTRKGGGAKEWIWKGTPGGYPELYGVFRRSSKNSIAHRFEFWAYNSRFALSEEFVENPLLTPESEDKFYFQNDGFVLRVRYRDESGGFKMGEIEKPIKESVLAELRDYSRYPEITWLGQIYEQIRIYREWSFGRNSLFREPQSADMRNDILEEDFSNLGMFLSQLRKTPKAKNEVIENLRKLYAGLTDFEVVAEGGSVQVFFTEGEFVIPASRLSDGTLRFLCLLAILCDPNPPPLICIEEPELGLHPDIIPTLADLLKSASERTQLIVTTHSDILVDAMTETPECVVVCEKIDGATRMERLSAEKLSVWLEKYRLGQLWIQGNIGGTRW